MESNGPFAGAAWRSRPGRSRGREKAAGAAIILAVAVSAVLLYLAPGFFPFPWGDGTVLVVGNQKIGVDKVIVDEREIYIAVEALQAHLDPHFFWDEAEKTAVITTADRVVHMYSDRLTAEVNLRPVELCFPLREEDDNLYLPLRFLADFYGLNIDYFPETDTVVVDRAAEAASLAEVRSRTVRLREGPGLRHPFLTVLERGERLRFAADEVGDKWRLVRTSNGVTGYLPRRSIAVLGPYPYPERPAGGDEPDPPVKKHPPRPLVMAWELTYPNPDVSTIPEMPPLHVVSPTWFHLRDGEGNLKNLADPTYARWAAEKGYRVWAAVTSFDPAITASVLSSSALRRKVIDQLLIYARLYGLGGLNLDFENFHYTYRDLYTQFVRELAPLCAAEGLVLSVDVTMISAEPYWSRGYDRKSLGEAADYIMLMAYDEHWHNAPVPGSVASLPWVERGLQKVLQEVPAEKLVLGVPFYCRLWQISSAGGGESVPSWALTMKTAEEILAGQDARVSWDSRIGQNVADYSEDGEEYRLWLEDGASMARRLELVNRYRLAGVAAWCRGQEKPEIWELFESILKDY